MSEPMRPEDVPDGLVEPGRNALVRFLRDWDARTLPTFEEQVRVVLAAALPAHERAVRVSMVAAGWESPAQIEQDKADLFRFADLLSWQIDVHRSKPGHENLNRRGCQTCRQFAEISEHPAIAAAREERTVATAEALVTGKYLACPASEERGEE